MFYYLSNYSLSPFTLHNIRLQQMEKVFAKRGFLVTFSSHESVIGKRG